MKTKTKTGKVIKSSMICKFVKVNTQAPCSGGTVDPTTTTLTSTGIC